jgi:hypothetical protein
MGRILWTWDAGCSMRMTGWALGLAAALAVGVACSDRGLPRGQPKDGAAPGSGGAAGQPPGNDGAAPAGTGGAAGSRVDAGGGGGAGGRGGPRPELAAVLTGGGRSLDVLFVMDNSSSMVPLQQLLASNFQSLVVPLEQVAGGLPSLHLGIVSTSMGAGIFSDVDGCNPERLENDDGDFHFLGRNPPGCSALIPGERFIVAGATGNNFANPSNTIAQVFGCMALLGSTGCGFEHPFFAIQRALEKGEDPSDPSNGGFLRPDAHLAIVMLTNEDDCSAPGSDLFNPGQTSNADPLGGLQTGYRCIEFGYLCNGQPPPRNITAPTALQSCTSAEERGRLVPVKAMADYIKSFKSAPSKIFVGAIAGPPQPVQVELRPNIQTASGNRESQPAVAHSCTTAGEVFADPGVRVAELVRAFGPTGFLANVCALDAPLMTRLGQALGRFVGEDGCIGTSLPLRADGTPDCFATETTVRPSGTQTVELPACGGAFPCWRISPGTSCASRFEVCRDPACAPTRSDAGVTASLHCNIR